MILCLDFFVLYVTGRLAKKFVCARALFARCGSFINWVKFHFSAEAGAKRGSRNRQLKVKYFCLPNVALNSYELLKRKMQFMQSFRAFHSFNVSNTCLTAYKDI